MADVKARMPPQIPFIIVNEGCERFTFYSMRNILQIFLPVAYFSQLPEAQRDLAAKDVLHTFMIGVYFFPLIGGFLADRFFGKYRTILVFSLIYTAGNVCCAAFVDSPSGFYAGLGLIALGSGGIKPLVASFMGDQFDARTKHLAKAVFAGFYWIINFGSFFASISMAFFLKQLGPTITFGIPGVLMLIATAVFFAARHRYIIIPRPPSDPDSFTRVARTALASGGLGFALAVVGILLGLGSIWLYVRGDLEIVVAICLALFMLLVFGGIGTWVQLERARGKHADAAIDGVRGVLRLLVVFALITPFWSLFDQKASTWVVQAKSMIKPDWFSAPMNQAMNPALVMLLIPLLNVVVWPALKKRGVEVSSLRRITWGLVFAAISWVIVGGMQLIIDGGDRFSVFSQLLPYAFLTLGEVLVSATCLEFAYSQAPPTMKGAIMSFYNLSVTMGNLWVLLADVGIKNKTVTTAITDRGLSPVAFLMFFFAGFAFLAAIAFKFYARTYREVDHYRTT
ncbi:MAG: oligopeptide:H+ symporter [Proteobacteria bacterium]|nr:oligopeptide:H+ symporter [Pseudomonadota bacterium]